jgi:hypothetical protein
MILLLILVTRYSFCLPHSFIHLLAFSAPLRQVLLRAKIQLRRFDERQVSFQSLKRHFISVVYIFLLVPLEIEFQTVSYLVSLSFNHLYTTLASFPLYLSSALASLNASSVGLSKIVLAPTISANSLPICKTLVHNSNLKPPS